VDVAVAVSNRSAWQDRLGAERQGFSVQRKLQDEIARMVATIKQGELARANPRGALLASLSVALPRTDWLTELAIKGDAVTLRGYALKIDELTKALERVTGQGEVQYQGETAYDARTERTRFAASFRMPSIAP
jgi:Tfp pilus assembly protein PilN